MSVTPSPCCHTLSIGSLPSTAGVGSTKILKPYVSFRRTNRFLQLFSSKIRTNNWRFSCFKHDESSLEHTVPETSENKLPEKKVELEGEQPNVKHNWVSDFRKVADGLLSAEPWAVPGQPRPFCRCSFFSVIIPYCLQ
ncbi:uncharacterized protein LOC143620296 [Bidens hawaiensis]|uniref:uncharacterized protein LOC143620296 n=1 Tax=Bidens hawaiensis TaxID=980011 RepID=UPI00404B1079